MSPSWGKLMKGAQNSNWLCNVQLTETSMHNISQHKWKIIFKGYKDILPLMMI